MKSPELLSMVQETKEAWSFIFERHLFTREKLGEMHWFILLNIILMFFSLKLCSTSVLGNQLLKLAGLGP